MHQKFFQSNLTSNVIASLLLILAALLPIQNTLVVFAVNVLGLPGWFALWKEVLLMVLVIVMFWQLIGKIKEKGFGLVNYLWFIGLFIILNALVFLTSFGFNQTTLMVFLTGYRFEIGWLWFLVFSFVWVQNCISTNFELYKKRLIQGIFLGFTFCFLISLGQLFVGKSFVATIGYTDIGVDQLGFRVYSPVCHVLDFGIETCRLAAPFSSPNHLAGYLIFVLAFSIYQSIKMREIENLQLYFQKSKGQSKFRFINPWFWFVSTFYSFTNFSFLPISIFVSILIFLTYSRFALIGLVLFWFFTLTYSLLQKYKGAKKLIFQFFGVVISLTFVFAILITSVDPSWSVNILPKFLSKPSSSLEHYRLTGVSVDILKSQPQILLTGLGQGASGSSTKYFDITKNVIYNKFKDISYKWFIKPERISVPENWYLQLILNGGLIYTLLYLLIIILPLYFTFRFTRANNWMMALIVLLGYLIILIGNIFLHLWENQTVVIYWTLILIWYTVDNFNNKTVE